jgi:ribosome recycling factor
MAMKPPTKKITIRSSAAEYLTFVAATRYTANEHFKKIFKDSELSEDATIRNFRIVQTDIYAAHDIHNISVNPRHLRLKNKWEPANV